MKSGADAGNAPASEAGNQPTIGSGSGGSEPAKFIRNITHGEKLADMFDEMKELTYTTGKEHAIVKLCDGTNALVSGGETGISFNNMPIKRLYFHTHPYSPLTRGASLQDMLALRQLGQRSSFLLENGALLRFYAR